MNYFTLFSVSAQSECCQVENAFLCLSLVTHIFFRYTNSAQVMLVVWSAAGDDGIIAVDDLKLASNACLVDHEDPFELHEFEVDGSMFTLVEGGTSSLKFSFHLLGSLVSNIDSCQILSYPICVMRTYLLSTWAVSMLILVNTNASVNRLSSYYAVIFTSEERD